MKEPEIIDAEFTVIDPPLKWWQGWRLTWNPWPAIGAAVLALSGLAQHWLHQ